MLRRRLLDQPAERRSSAELIAARPVMLLCSPHEQTPALRGPVLLFGYAPNQGGNTANEHAACLHRSGAALYIAVAVTGGVVYLRLVKGWKLADMLYVTRSGLKKSIAQVTEGTLAH